MALKESSSAKGSERQVNPALLVSVGYFKTVRYLNKLDPPMRP